MIVSRTPVRCSFLGGMSDYPCWYEEHGGAVLSTTIDKYIYVVLKHMYPLYEQKMRLSYSQIENCNEVCEIQHPVIRAIMDKYHIPPYVDIHCLNDLPARAGMGSSSAFTVGLLNVIFKMNNTNVNLYDLVISAIDIERNILKETVGSQDQIAAAYGGFNKIIFHNDGKFTVQPVPISTRDQRELTDHLLLFYTKKQRKASETVSQYVNNIRNNDCIHTLVKMVDQAYNAIIEYKYDDFGSMLDEAWQIKCSISPIISDSDIENAYNIAKSNGALGGKVLGAGAGGFLLLYTPIQKKNKVYSALIDSCMFDVTQYVPFYIENSGSQIVYND